MIAGKDIILSCCVAKKYVCESKREKKRVEMDYGKNYAFLRWAIYISSWLPKEHKLMN